MQDFRRLLRYVRPYWVSFVVALIAMVGVAVFETATGLLVKPIFDQFIGSEVQKASLGFNIPVPVPTNDWFKAWLIIAVLLITFSFLKGVSDFVSSFLMARLGQKGIFQLRNDLYDHLLSQSTAFFERHRTNFLVSRLVVSCSLIENAISITIRDIIRESFTLICFLGAALYFNWRLTLGSLIIGPIVAYMTVRFSALLKRFSIQSLEGNKQLADHAQETLSNTTIIKAYQAENRERGRFEEAAKVIARANIRAGRILSISPPSLELIGAFMIAALCFFGLREINAGRLVASEFFTFLYFLLRSYDPIRKLSRQHNDLTKALAAARDVWEVMDENEEIPEKTDAVELRPLSEKITFSNVSFGYANSSDKILRSIDLEVRKGSTVALVGESGSGKSTLVKLVQRLYDPTEGTIKWDGIDIRSASINSLRKQIALVTQDTVLFNDTVLYNISYGDPAASDEMIRKAAKTAYAEDFIDALPDGYDTIVGERGTFLSGGQRQRIAIARAVLRNAPVLLLDEATSALDAESETLVQKALANLMQGRTSIVIAHRLSTIRQSDLIVVMENGEIIESGSHRELLDGKGRYRKFYELQFEDPAEDPIIVKT